MAGVLCASMLISTGAPAMQVRAAESGDPEWEKISQIMDTFAEKAVWTNSNYSNAISQRMPSTAILGNGDIGATSYGNAAEKTWLLSSNNFWSDNSLYFGYVGRSPQIITGGGLTISPTESQHPYNLAYHASATASSQARDHGASLTTGGLYVKNTNGDGKNFTGWEAGDSEMPQWVLYDFTFAQKLDRIVVRHDNYTSKAGMARNTRDFEVQTLKPGVNPEEASEGDWITLEKVQGNEQDSTQIKLSVPQEIRYLRLFITKATAEEEDGIARIGQLEAYYQNDDYNMPVTDNKGSEHPYNKIYGMPVYASSQTVGHEAGKAVEGLKQAEGWVSEIGQEQYLVVDLKTATRFNRWQVKHDNYTSKKGQNRNTVDFALQTSSDGINWVTVDSVKGNQEDVTDRKLLYDHTARYLRLHITKPSREDSSVARARISQFEIYRDDNYGLSYATVDQGAKASASSVMNDGRSADNMINDNWFTSGNGGNDYCGWVSGTTSPHWAKIDLGEERTFDELAILHTGLQAQTDDLTATGNPNSSGYKKFTTRDYSVQVSTNGGNWETLDTVAGNTSSIYDKKLSEPVTARYIRINISKAEQSGNSRARILKVYVYNNMENPLFSMPLEFEPEDPGTNPDEGKDPIAPEEAQYNLAYQANVTASTQTQEGPAAAAVSGVFQYTDASREQAFEGWVSEPGQEQYLQLTFEDMVQFNRWHVKHNNSTTGAGEIYNTKDFRLEISRNGSDWISIDSVTDNQADITDRRMLYPISAKAVRLSITRASGETDSEARARISQFELYLDEDFRNSFTMADKGASVEVSSDPYTTKENLISDNFIKLDKNNINDYNGWISLHAAMPQWATVNLGQVRTIDEVGVLLAGAEGLVQDLAAGGAVNADNSKYTDDEGNIGYRRFKAKKFTVSVSKDGDSWETVGDYTDNRDGQVSVKLLQPMEVQYIKVHVTQGQQTPASDQRARIAKIYAFNNAETPKVCMPVEEYPVYKENTQEVLEADVEPYQALTADTFDPETTSVQAGSRAATAFREEMDIAKAQVRTTMDMGAVPVQMVNWLSAEENLMITTITSNGDQDQTIDISPWGKDTLTKTTTDSNVLSKPRTIAQSGVSGEAVWATRKSNVEDEIQKKSDGTQSVNAADWMSEFAIASKVLGGENAKYGAQDNTGIIRVNIPAGETVTVVTAIDCAPNQKTDAPDGEKGLAVKQAMEILDQIQDARDVEELKERHEKWWQDYYKLSYADLGDTSLNRLYYGSQYIFGCCTREGEQAPGLYGVWTTTDNSGWQGDYHLNYNFQSPYYGSYSSNRLKEFSQPMFDVFIEYMDSGLERAANPEHLKSISSWYYGTREEDFQNGFTDALLYPVGLKPYKVTADGASYLNQTINALFCASQICAYYNYTLDREWLMTKQASASGNMYSPYDFLVKTANFYEQWVEKRGARVDQEYIKDNPCSDAGGQSQTTKYTANYAKYPEYNGKGDYVYVLFDGSHEGSFEFNPNVTVGNLQNLLDTLVSIGKDAAPTVEKYAVWEDISSHLPGMEASIYKYQGFNANSIKNSKYLGKKIFGLSEDRKIRPISATVNMESVHPGEQLGFDSDPYLLEVARNTVDVCGNDGYSYGSAGWNMVNNTPKIFTHAARVQYDAATLISKIKQFVVNKMAGNYYVKDNTHGWEKVGVSEALNDMMVFSHNGFIKVFPTWNGSDASFKDIRVKGAMLVSSQMKDGQVSDIRISSETSGSAKVVIPWEQAYVTDKDGLMISSAYGQTENSKEKTIEFSTKEGETYTITPLGNSNEEFLALLENMLRAAEDARKAAEDAWANAEAERQAAQEAQKAAGEDREKAEQAKAAAEKAREAAEDAKKAAEDAQKTVEKLKAEIEEERAAAEAAWKKAEEERQKAEAEAKKAEEERQKAEAEAKRAEEERQKAEAEAKKAEEERQKAEAEAKRAEEERQKAEDAWRKAEEERQAAAEEAKRAEENRQLAEEEAKKTERDRKAVEEAQKQVEEALKAVRETQKAVEEAQKRNPNTTALVQGKTYTAGIFEYKVKSSTAERTEVALSGTTNNKLKNAVIPSEIKINGVICKVTEIGPRALKGQKQLKKVSIGTNIVKIGKRAFEGDAKLTSIIVKTKRLKSVESGAFKGISSKAVIRIPKARKKAYTKLLKNRGQKKSVKIKAK